MSGAQEYYGSLIAQGYTPEQAKGFTQQHVPDFSPAAAMPAPMPAAPHPMAAPMAAAPQMGMPMGAPMGGMMPAPGNGPSILNWVALGLVAVSITMLLIAMFEQSWMVAQDNWIIEEEEDNFPEYYFGLSEFIIDSGGNGQYIAYDGWNCNEEECSDMDSAGSTTMIILCIAILAAINALIMMCLNNFNVYNSKFGMIACFVSGNLAIIGTIIWLIMFPEVGELAPMNVGMSFYMAIISGVFIVGAGVCEIITGRNPNLD